MNSLGDYLRRRREQVQPSDVGLPDRGRRRTPGLRREEVATLAGISVDYLVRLEQGRDQHPSQSVLRALADALQVPEAERVQLWKVAHLASSPELCPGQDLTLPLVARPEVAALLGHLDVPAMLLDPVDAVLDANDRWRRLVAPTGLLDHEGEHDVVANLAAYTFRHPEARRTWADWEHVAGQHVARLRSAEHRWGHDEAFVALLADLGADEAFGERWAALPPPEQQRGDLRLVHPEVGRLRLVVETLVTADELSPRLVTWLPADELSAERLASALGEAPPATGRPARLRVVG